MRPEREETLLELRACTKGHAAALARKLGVPHSTARKRIKALEDRGIVTGYIPIVNQKVFGTPYFTEFRVSFDQYRFEKDLTDTIDEICVHLSEGIGHAPYVIFNLQNEQDQLWTVSCLTSTSDIESLISRICRRHNVLPENTSCILLNEVSGVPMYSRHSMNNGLGEDD
jgi:DNA-binding Lrp family transcriptional regulator